MVSQVRQHLDSKLSSITPQVILVFKSLFSSSHLFSHSFQPKSPAGFPTKSQFKIKKAAGAASHTPSDSPSYSDVRQRPSSSASGGAVSARAHVRLLLAFV
jgi:hypothetical protein